jgi:hypothetical protein
MSMSLKALGKERLLSLLESQPHAVISIEMSSKTDVALLDRTGLLHKEPEGDTIGKQAPAAASASSKFVPVYADVHNESESMREENYLLRTAGLYRLSQGFSICYKGKYFAGFKKVLYDTGYEIGLMSQEYADRHGIRNQASELQVSTSLGGSGSVVGKVDEPVHCVLNEGSSVESSTFGHAATKFLVVKGVDNMYDVLISTHCAKEWGSRPDPVTSLLEYRPFLTWGDLKTMASIPLYATAAQSWSELHAAGEFVCGFAAANPAEVIAVPKHEHAPVLSAASGAYFAHSAHLKEPDD